MNSGNPAHDTAFVQACDQARARRTGRDWLYSDSTIKIGVGDNDASEGPVIVHLYGATPELFKVWRAICEAQAVPNSFAYIQPDGEYRLRFIPTPK